jgi:phosphonate transport system ATP-binding protein
MRLLTELVRERGTPALVNIHDVALAQSFSDRIIGLRDGKIVFEGTTDQVTEAVLTTIYGEEDWSLTIRKKKDPALTEYEKPSAQKNKIIHEAAAG